MHKGHIQRLEDMCMFFNHEATYIRSQKGLLRLALRASFLGGMFSLEDWGVLVWHMLDSSLATDE